MQNTKANGAVRPAVKKTTLKDLSAGQKSGGVKGGAKYNTIEK